MSSFCVLNYQQQAMLPLAQLPFCDFDDFRNTLLEEVASEARVVSYFGQPDSESVVLYAVLARDIPGELVVLRTRINEKFPALTPECPQLHLFERELAEQYNVRPEGHPWLKPVRFHQSWIDGADIWGRGSSCHPVPGDMDFYQVAGEEVHEVAVGPVHAGVIEPGHFRFQCHGEEVMHLEISLGYQHRGIEQMLVGGPHPASIYQFETIAGDTTIGHMTAYSQLIESLSGISIAPRAQAIRGIALELERLANHVGDVGAIAGDVGFLPTSAFCGRLRGDYLNLMAEICGSRFGRGLVRPGGVQFDLDQQRLETIVQRLNVLAVETRGAIELCFDSPSVLARLEGTGKVSSIDASSLGLVGVAARACGLILDSRKHFPGISGDRSFTNPVIEGDGDVFARGNVRRREIYASHRMLDAALSALPDGGVGGGHAPLAPESLAVSFCEGWRGEIVHVAITDERGQLARYKVVDPSFHNWSGLAMALRGEQISDFPLCNKSFNLSYCGFDL